MYFVLHMLYYSIRNSYTWVRSMFWNLRVLNERNCGVSRYTIKSKFCAEKYTLCVYQQRAASYCVSVISCFIVSTLVLWQVLFSVLRGSSTAMCDYSIWVSFDIWRFQPSVWMSDSITLCFCTLTHIWYPRSYKNMFPGLFLNPVTHFTFVSLVLESLMSRYVV